MDQEDLSLAETERALADLRRVNRWLLGYGPVLRTLLPLLRRGPERQTLVDLGTGSGDVAEAVARAARQRGIELQVVGVDRKLPHLTLGRQRHPGGWRVVASADALPFAEDAVDWSLSTLFFHHFGGKANGRILGEMRRISRRAVAVIDLRQSFLLRTLLGPLLGLLGVARVARLDGVTSARAAWGLAHLRALVAHCGTPALELRRRFPFRFSLVLPGQADRIGSGDPFEQVPLTKKGRLG